MEYFSLFSILRSVHRKLYSKAIQRVAVVIPFLALFPFMWNSVSVWKFHPAVISEIMAEGDGNAFSQGFSSLPMFFFFLLVLPKSSQLTVFLCSQKLTWKHSDYTWSFLSWGTSPAWNLACFFYISHKRHYFTHQITPFCTLVISDFAVIVSLLAFLFYKTPLVFALSIHFIFSYVFVVVYFNWFMVDFSILYSMSFHF